MEPESLNRHGTNPSIRTGRGFGKPSWALLASTLPACPAAGVPQDPLASSGPDETLKRISEAG